MWSEILLITQYKFLCFTYPTWFVLLPTTLHIWRTCHFTSSHSYTKRLWKQCDTYAKYGVLCIIYDILFIVYNVLMRNFECIHIKLQNDYSPCNCLYTPFCTHCCNLEMIGKWLPTPWGVITSLHNDYGMSCHLSVYLNGSKTPLQLLNGYIMTSNIVAYIRWVMYM